MSVELGFSSRIKVPQLGSEPSQLELARAGKFQLELISSKWSIIDKTWSTYLKNGPSGRKVTQDGWVRMRNVNGPRRLSL